MTADDVQAWLDRYLDAWRSYSPEAIGALFTHDAEYRYHPSDEPVRGRDAIVRSWLEPEGPASSRDEPGTFEAHYAPYAVEGDRAVAIGWSRYWTDASQTTVARTYDNSFLLRFDPQGRCASFTEFYVKRREG
jgi:hypothetical protein